MYGRIYGILEPSYPGIISFVAGLALENIATNDAAYHEQLHEAKENPRARVTLMEDGRLLQVDKKRDRYRLSKGTWPDAKAAKTALNEGSVDWD